MKLIQHPDGSADLVFEENEKKIIAEKGKFHFDVVALENFGTVLVTMVSEFLIHKQKNKK